MLKPPRTVAQDHRDAYLASFAAVGLVPVISTNGSIPDADIQTVNDVTVKGGAVIACWITERGKARLQHAA